MNKRKEITLYPSKKQHLLLLIISALFTSGGIFIGLKGDWVGYLCSFFFGLGIPIFIMQMLPGASYLKLSSSGLEYSSLFKRHSVKWQNIKEFGIMTQTQSGLTVNKMVGWNYNENQPDPSISKKISKSLAGIEAGLPDTYGLQAEELLTLLQDYCDAQTESGRPRSFS